MGTTRQKKDFSYEEYLELLKQGKNKTQIIKHFGLSRATFYKLLKAKEGNTDDGEEFSVEVPCKSEDVLDNMKNELFKQILSANLSDEEAQAYCKKASDLFCTLDELVSQIQLASKQNKTRAIFNQSTSPK